MNFVLGALAAFALLAVLVALGGLTWWLWYSNRRREPAAAPAPDKLQTTRAMMERRYERKLEKLVLDVAELKLTVGSLPGVWKEESKRAHRAAEREAKAEQRNRAQPQSEDEEPEDQLSLEDGGGGAPSWVHPLQARVAGSGEQQAYLSEVRRRVALSPLKGN